jgi:UDP-N-acetylglucosamine 1-carboxyvinyltransferase
MTQASGTSTIIEAVHNNRLQFSEQLNAMGAKIELFNPDVKDPETYYEFDIIKGWDTPMHAARITGPTDLKAATLYSPDLRGGATLTIAGLIARGQSTIEQIDHIERGYENLHDNLLNLGAEIKRVE